MEGIEQLRVHPLKDPFAAVVELKIQGRALATNRPYNQSYVVFFELKNSKLWRYREYWNPLISIDAFGGREIWTASFGRAEDESP